MKASTRMLIGRDYGHDQAGEAHPLLDHGRDHHYRSDPPESHGRDRACLASMRVLVYKTWF